MLKSYDMLKADYKSYKAPEMKIKRMTETGHIVRLRRDLYESDPETPGYVDAGAIVSPSYLSFEYALSRYGLIPERVAVYTCATCTQKKRKLYENGLGSFMYQDIPQLAFPYEIKFFGEPDRPYLMASAEKALCDKLYTLKSVRSKKELKEILFENLRIDEELFSQLDFSVLKELCPLYRSTTLNTFQQMIGDYL